MTVHHTICTTALYNNLCFLEAGLIQKQLHDALKYDSHIPFGNNPTLLFLLQIQHFFFKNRLPQQTYSYVHAV